MNQNNFPANEVKIQGIFDLKQITPTFQKQILLIRAKDTRDQQWKNAELEIYIKPDLLTQNQINSGDTIIVDGWIAFNFSPNGTSFPRVVATNVVKVQSAQQNQANQSNQQSQFNHPQQVAPQAQTQSPSANVGIPEVPQMPSAF